jgi:hypothetical protein
MNRETPLTTTCSEKHCGGGEKSVVEMTVNKEENSKKKTFAPITSKNSTSGHFKVQSINASFMRDQSITAIYIDLSREITPLTFVPW